MELQTGETPVEISVDVRRSPSMNMENYPAVGLGVSLHQSNTHSVDKSNTRSFDKSNTRSLNESNTHSLNKCNTRILDKI